MTQLELYTQPLRDAGAQGKSFDEAIDNEVDFLDVAEKLGVRYGTLRRALINAHREGLEAHRLTSWAIQYTTASAAYDWMGTEDLGPAGVDGSKTWRKVRINPKYVRAQGDRYLSGCCGCVDQVEFDKLVAYGLVKLA